MVTFHADAADFLDVVEQPLLGREAEHSVLLGIAATIAREGFELESPPVLATLSGDGGLRAAALRMAGRPWVLAVVDEDAVAEMVEALVRADSDCPGVVASTPWAAAFAEHWSALTGRRPTRMMGQMLYELTAVSWPKTPAPGSLRQAEATDEALVAGWIQAFAVEAIPHEAGDLAAARRTARRRIEAGDICLWEHHQPVALGAFSRETATGVTINTVYTPPEHRASGYASILVASMCRKALERGKRACFLYADRANPTSNSIYQRLGFAHVCDSEHWVFEP